MPCCEWRFLFLLLFNYGLRISECLGLRWTDFKGDGLHIERCACVKNDSHKVIFTSPKTSNSYRLYPTVDAIMPYIARFKPAYLKENHQVFEADKKARSYLAKPPSEGIASNSQNKPDLSPSGSTNSATPACLTY